MYRLLHENVCYKTFMLSLMATNTILYMGFSFNDEYSPPHPPPPHPSFPSHRVFAIHPQRSDHNPFRYLNEMRSEVVSMLRPRSMMSHSALPSTLPGLQSQPIACGMYLRRLQPGQAAIVRETRRCQDTVLEHVQGQKQDAVTQRTRHSGIAVGQLPYRAWPAPLVRKG